MTQKKTTMTTAKKKKGKFRPRDRRDYLSYKLGKYILEHPENHSVSVNPYRLESRCRIPKLRLDRAYKDSNWTGAVSIIKEINHRRTLPVNPVDVKESTVLWVVKDKRIKFLNVGYPLEFIAKNNIFFDENEPLLLEALELLESKIAFDENSVSELALPYTPKKKDTNKIVTLFEVEKTDNSII